MGKKPPKINLPEELEDAFLTAFPGGDRKLEPLKHGVSLSRDGKDVASMYTSELKGGNSFEIALDPAALGMSPSERAAAALWLVHKGTLPGRGESNVHKRGDRLNWFRLGFMSKSEAINFLTDMKQQQNPLLRADQKWVVPVAVPAVTAGADNTVDEVTITTNLTPPRLAGTIPQFVVGQEYSRRDEIHLNYGGSRQSGISSSATCPAIFLFTGDTGEQYGYRDDFDPSGVFSYTGEGQVGDMEFKTGNRSIRDHAADGRALYLFRSLGKGKRQQYLGEFVLANYSIRRGPDREGNERSVIVFHLLRVDATQEAPASVNHPTKSISLSEAREKALAACSGVAGAAGKQAVHTVYERSKAIRDYVLLRAKGKCEACTEPAPFFGRDAQPYLEAHHTTRLSDGGVDHPRHVAALCPTCHREIHYGQNGQELNKNLVDLLAHLEPIT